MDYMDYCTFREYLKATMEDENIILEVMSGLGTHTYRCENCGKLYTLEEHKYKELKLIIGKQYTVIQFMNSQAICCNMPNYTERKS